MTGAITRDCSLDYFCCEKLFSTLKELETKVYILWNYPTSNASPDKSEIPWLCDLATLNSSSWRVTAKASLIWFGILNMR